MNSSKRYYTIGEVAKIVGKTIAQLRNADSAFVGKLTKIRGRRYYKPSEIEKLQRLDSVWFSAASSVKKKAKSAQLTFTIPTDLTLSNQGHNASLADHSFRVKEVDSLLAKFYMISEKIDLLTA